MHNRPGWRPANSDGRLPLEPPCTPRAERVSELMAEVEQLAGALCLARERAIELEWRLREAERALDEAL